MVQHSRFAHPVPTPANDSNAPVSQKIPIEVAKLLSAAGRGQFQMPAGGLTGGGMVEFLFAAQATAGNNALGQAIGGPALEMGGTKTLSAQAKMAGDKNAPVVPDTNTGALKDYAGAAQIAQMDSQGPKDGAKPVDVKSGLAKAVGDDEDSAKQTGSKTAPDKGPKMVGGGGGGSVGGAIAPDPAAVQQRASAIAGSLPVAPKQTAKPAPKTQPAPARKNAGPAARKAIGPPPIPVVKSSYEGIEDPVKNSTKAIEEAGAATLPNEALPPLAQPSPGGHIPSLSAVKMAQLAMGKSGVDAQQLRRFLTIGIPSMNEAGLTGDQKQKVAELHNQLLNPKPAEPPVPATPPAPPSKKPLAGKGAVPKGKDKKAAEPDAPAPRDDVLTVASAKLPSAELAVEQQKMFTTVLARLMADTGNIATGIVDQVKGDMKAYQPKRLLNSEGESGFSVLKALGQSHIEPIGTKLKDSSNATARSMGVAQDTLDQAVTSRKLESQAEQAHAADAIEKEAQIAFGNAVIKHDTRIAKAQQVQAVGADAKKQANAAKGKRVEPDFKARVDAATARIQDKVGMAIARFNLLRKERDEALDKVLAQGILAYELAVTGDELQASKNKPPSTTDPAAQQAHKIATGKAITNGKAWLKIQEEQLKVDITSLKTRALGQTKTMIEAVQTAGATAFRDLRAWGDKQKGADAAWWRESSAKLDSWANNAYETANTWALAEAHLARLQMQRDLELAEQEVWDKVCDDKEARAKLDTLTDKAKAEFRASVMASSAGQRSIIELIAGKIRGRLLEGEKDAIEKTVATEIGSISGWKVLEYLAQGENPDFNAEAKANKIYRAGEDKIGTDEITIFQQLEGLNSLELKAVTNCYNAKHGENALFRHLDGELSGDEWKRAKALMAGGDEGQASAAVYAIYYAIDGPMTDEDEIMRVLRNLKPEQRQRAEELYEQRYGETIAAALAGDMEGSELGQAMALKDGRLAEADAYEIDNKLRGGFWGPDNDGVKAVYDRNRDEALKEAKAGNWTEAEFEAAVSERNGQIETSFNEKMANVPQYGWGGRGQSKLRTAITYANAYDPDPAQRDLLNALADNNMPAADAALMETERQGAWADDDVLNGVVKKQYDRAHEKAKLNAGPEAKLRINRELEAADAKSWKDEGHGLSARKWEDTRMALQRKADNDIADRAFDDARDNSVLLDAVLKKKYNISLDNMIGENMSGNDRMEARSNLKIMRSDPNSTDPEVSKLGKERRLRWAYNKMYYAVDGVGTDTEQLDDGVNGLTKEELKTIDGWWIKERGESMRSAIAGDVSGREGADLLYKIDNGAPETLEARMKELEDKAKRDNEKVGILGAATSSDEAALTQQRLREMRALSKDLDDPKLSPMRRNFMIQAANQRIESASIAIEDQRAAVDSLADKLTTIFQYVVGAIAVIVGAIVAVVSGGTALPLLIAIAGSLIGTLGGMGIKAAVKGGYYGIEEIGTDLAVGAVDLLVTVATAGMFKGGKILTNAKTLMALAKEEMKVAGKATIKSALGQAGRKMGLQTAEEAAKSQVKKEAASKLTMAGKFVAGQMKGQAHQFTTALPTAITANLMDERNWRKGNVLKNVARGTLDASLENLKQGAIMGVAGGLVHAGVQRGLNVQHAPRLPAEVQYHDMLKWKFENPGKSKSDFLAHVEAKNAAAAQDAVLERKAIKEIRTEVLSDVPPKLRKAIADVPIIRVTEAEMAKLAGLKGVDAMVHVKDGQTAIVMRDGAPPSAAAGLSKQLLETVAPNSAGRTKNPADALPSRLRNRVGIEPVDIDAFNRTAKPGKEFAADEIRVVPERNPDGTIKSVKMLVGPEARATDIKAHVDTADAMRQLVGLEGKARHIVAKASKALGGEGAILNHGQWEAQLEVRKLRPIIAERIARLSETGLDPRRKGLVMGEIQQLQRQLEHHATRLEQGADADALGYVAAGAKHQRRAKAAKIEEVVLPKEEVDAREDYAKLVVEKNGLEPKYREMSESIERLNDNVTNRKHELEQVLEHVTDRLDRSLGRSKRSPIIYDDLLKLLASGNDSDVPLAFDNLKTWLEKAPKSNLTDTLRNIVSDYDKYISQRDMGIPKLLERFKPVNESWQDLTARINSSPLHAKWDYWSANLKHGDLGKPGALICFPPGTPVASPNGTIAIECIKPGTNILSYDMTTHRSVVARVIRVFQGHTQELVEISVADGEIVKATGRHPFFEGETRKWVQARALHPGAKLFCRDGHLQSIISVRTVVERTPTHNLEVETHHCYFVGATPVLVHNAGDDGDELLHLSKDIKRDGKIYVIVDINPSSPTFGEVIYVGKTYTPEKVRWKAHLANKKKGWTERTHKMVVVEHGSMTDFKIAVLEQHYIKAYGGLKKDNPSSKLINDRYELTEDTFDFYRKYHKDLCP